MFEDERFEVRIYTLADWAAIPPDGKLYIGGGSVDQMYVADIPGSLGPLYLAIRVRVPWRFTSQELPIQVRVLDADRNPVAGDPFLGGTIEVGRPPGARPGDEMTLQLVAPVTGFPVRAEETLYFHLLVAGVPLAVLPLKIRRRTT